MNVKKCKFKINCNYPGMGVKKGDVLNIDVDKNGIPVKQFWRRRLRDSLTDSCIEKIKSDSYQRIKDSLKNANSDKQDTMEKDNKK